MWQQEFTWFFAIFHHEFRKNNPVAFEVLMVLAVANLFGFYNPKQLADFLDKMWSTTFEPLCGPQRYVALRSKARCITSQQLYGHHISLSIFSDGSDSNSGLHGPVMTF